MAGGALRPFRDTRPLLHLQRELEASTLTCGSGRAREAGDVVAGTGFAGVRG